MTKVMSLIIAVENIQDLNKTYRFGFEELNNLYIQQASVAGFSVDEEVTANDLLYGLALPSGADAAYGIAQITAGSEEEFVKLMNEKCEEMGLKNTHFCNPSGLHDVNQYTTPAEMAMIMEYAMSNEVCAKVLWKHTSIQLRLHHSTLREYILQAQCSQEWSVMKCRE